MRPCLAPSRPHRPSPAPLARPPLRPDAPRPPRAAVALLGALVVLAAGGCDGASSGGRFTIDEVRQLTEPRPIPPTGLSDAVRFGWAAPPGGAGGGAGAEDEARLAWTLPAGWRSLPPTAMRLGSFAVEGRPEIDCSLSILPGRAGGLADNVNRWRQQLGQPALDDAGIAALPRRRILGVEGVLVEADGTYAGMTPSGERAAPREGYKLLGIIAQQQGEVAFVKMTGPAADVEAERERFEALVASIHVDDPHSGHDHGSDPHAGHDHGADPHAGHDHEANPHAAGEGAGPAAPGAAPPAGRSAGGGPLGWTTPSGWSEGAQRPMRIATFVSPASPEVDCYLATAGGGLAANLNRWLGQIGKPPLPEAAIATMQQVTVLGRAATLVDERGTFQGMDGVAKSGQRVLGIICPLEGGQSLFVKMTGPEAAVERERERFLALVASLRLEAE